MDRQMNDSYMGHELQTSGSKAANSEDLVADVLVKDRLELQHKLEELNERIDQTNKQYTTVLGQLAEEKRPIEEAMFHIDALLKLKGLAREPQPAVIGSQHSGAGDESVSDATYAILQSEGRALHYKDIASKLKERGLSIPGKNPAATLLTRISRDARFKRDKKRGMYVLAAWRSKGVARGRRRRSMRLNSDKAKK